MLARAQKRELPIGLARERAWYNHTVELAFFLLQTCERSVTTFAVQKTLHVSYVRRVDF